MSLPSHLQIDLADQDFDVILSEWRWLVDESYTPVLMTFLGDLFMKDAADRIFFLDLKCGSLEEVASSEAELEAFLGDRAARMELVLGFLHAELKSEQGPLECGECYSCKIPPTLGGALDPENFGRADIQAHYSILGQLQGQIRGLPEGTRIKNVHIDDGKVSLETS